MGEHFLAGSGVALGYLHHPALTAERFLPDPFADDGSRMYRTGDRVRADAAGVLTFHGRMDDQLKIRGFRVEPGEVEARLRGLAGVSAACVLGRETEEREAGGRKWLHAFFVGEAEEAEVAARLRAVLPEYMVPRRIDRLAAMPLTRNGKMDRARLAQEGEAGPGPAPSEAGIDPALAVMRELIGAPELTAASNFFDVGGDSLLAMRIAAKLSDRCALVVPLEAFFEHESLGEMLAAVRGSANTA